MFGRATITLGIGPHSSLHITFLITRSVPRFLDDGWASCRMSCARVYYFIILYNFLPSKFLSHATSGRGKYT